MKKHIKLLTVAAIAAFAITAIAATSAQAFMRLTDVFASDQPSFVGWAHAESKANENQQHITAYYSVHGQWRTFDLQKGEWVYVERYASGWDWAYSYTYHYWFVLPTNDIFIRQQAQGANCTPRAGYACPM